MLTITRVTFLAAALTALAGTAAYAHHSYGDVFRDQTVSMEGNVDQFLFANPHAVLSLKTKDAVLYMAEWGNVRTLGEAGVTSSTFKIGDYIVVTGSPMRDPAVHKLTLLKEVRRPSDGWRWARTPPSTTPR
jgi:hypothetical protein